MKHTTIFAFTLGCGILVLPHIGSAGGYAEPVYEPQVIAPYEGDCPVFLFWKVCAPENPSPRRPEVDREGPEDRRGPPPEETPEPQEPSRPGPAAEPEPEPEPAPEPERPSVPEPEAPEEPGPDQPVDGGDKGPHKDPTKPGHGYGDKNHQHQHRKDA